MIMSVVRKSIAVTQQQSDWIKSRIAEGLYTNDSEYIRDLIRHDQSRHQESPEEIAAIRKALEEGKASGFSDRSVDEIWADAKQQVFGS